MRGRNLTITRPGSAKRYCNFSVNGRRFRDSLGTDSETDAEIIAAKIRSEVLLGHHTGRKAEISLTQALGRFWIERAQYAASADDMRLHGLTLEREIGAGTLLSELDGGMLSAFVARRRVRTVGTGKKRTRLSDRANGSINREIGFLRTVMLAARGWGFAVAEIGWKRLFLEEPDKVQHILTEAEEDALFAELRPDYHGLVRFALVTGVRLDNAISLSWRQIDWSAETMTFRTKSRRPGGALHVLPLTRAVAAILGHERGNHDLFVFTYECLRNRHDPRAGVMQNKGERYPFSHDGWRGEWDRVRRAIGLPQLRFHDLRHTAATRALYAHRNLKTVQRMLGHADIATTQRYTASDVADVRAAMESVAAQFRHNAPRPTPIIKGNQRG